MYIFIDPGQNTGWAKFDDNGELVAKGTTRNFEDLVYWVADNINVGTAEFTKKCIVEDFKLYPSKAQAQLWSQFETVQVIGAIRSQCLLVSIPYEVVPAHNKQMGFMYLGTKEPPHSSPLNHEMVAIAHGVFWLQNKGIRPPARR